MLMKLAFVYKNAKRGREVGRGEGEERGERKRNKVKDVV